MMMNRGAQNVQIVQPVSGLSSPYGLQSTLLPANAAFDTSAAQNVTFHASVTNAADLVALDAYIVEVFYGA